MIPLTGYVDRLSARPGDRLEFKVSSQGPEPYEVQLIRIVSADPNPEGPGIVHHAVAAACNGRYPSRRQDYALGSYGEVALPGALAPESVTVTALVWPTLPGREQVVLSWLDGGRGLELVIGAAGAAVRLAGAGGAPLLLAAGQALAPHRWYRLWASYDAASGRLSVGQAALGARPRPVEAELRLEASPRLELAGHLRIAAGAVARPDRHFEGKLEAPRLFDRALDLAALERATPDESLAAWDFAQRIATLELRDAGPRGLHGRLVNLPTRGVTSSGWRGRETCWRHAPEDYAAIHFHSDDCYDCGWDTDFAFTVPDELPSGVYAMRLRCGGHEDTIVFFVAAPAGRPRAPLCVVIPTFTYLAYANNARYDFGPALEARMAAWKAAPWNPARHPDYGLCTYNLHPDGSGICFGSARRPLLTLRSGYLTLLAPGCGSGLRHFQADTHLLAWLEHEGLAYDVVTDHQLHAEGAAALAPYRAVLTCTHPEYHTAESLDAFQGYLEGGGRLAYLGGNGFYWRIAVSEAVPDVIEVRRAEGGLRTWAAAPGEGHHMLDGLYGGLWRRNGRPPQALVGVGFSAQGTFLGSWYRRAPASHEPRHAWLFAGVEGEVLGDFGLSGGGAAGYELDRVDPALGTPPEAVVLASSEAHAPTYMVTPEEILTHVSTVSGEPRERLVRADMVHYETPAGGEVFSVGSITFCGSLPWNGFRNPVARLLGNVVRRFLG